MTNHNGYVLEQLYSPLVVVTTAAHEELMQLGKGCVTRPTVRHYQGSLGACASGWPSPIQR